MEGWYYEVWVEYVLNHFSYHTQLFRKEKWPERGAYFTTRSCAFEASTYKA